MAFIPNQHLDYIINTTYGKIRGTRCGDPRITVFRGIPYAKPPIGELRFRDPVKPDKWDGILDCTNFAPSAIMPFNPDEFYQNEFHLYPMESSEDCLYLNIWSPAGHCDEKLPVMFWIHGGGNSHGYSHEMEFDGEALAKKGVILVTLGYRMNVLGFLPHPELTARNGGHATCYLGLFDIIAALDWVRENIESFGGNSDCITVFGQSAGGANVVSLLSSPLVNGKMHRAIVQSGFGMFHIEPKTLTEYNEEMQAFCEARGVGIKELLDMDAQDLVDRLYTDENGNKDLSIFRVRNDIVDGYLLNQEPVQAVINGTEKDIPTMIGCVFGDGHMQNGELPDHEIYQRVTSGSVLMAESHIKNNQLPVYAYLLDRLLPGNELCPENRAYHSSDLWYIFGTFHRSDRPMTGRDFELSNQMIEYWTNFAKNGIPSSDHNGLNWKPFTAEERNIMLFGNDSNKMIQI